MVGLRRKRTHPSLKPQAQKLYKNLLDYDSGSNYYKRKNITQSLKAAMHFYELRKGDRDSIVELEHRMLNATLLLENEKEVKGK